MSDAVCRLLMFSSLAFNTTNDIALEFSTPKAKASVDDAYAFCLTDFGYQQTINSVQVLALFQGGDQFDTGESLIVTQNASSAFKSAAVAWDVDFVQVATLYDILGTDPYFADSYRVTRYDDWYHKELEGVALRSMWGTPRPPASAQAVSSATPSSLDAAQQLLKDSVKSNAAAAGNCIVLTGAWLRDTRYELHLRIQNPRPPSSKSAPASNGRSASGYAPPPNGARAPRVWLAPLKYGKSPAGHLTIRVAGPSKYGAVCGVPQALEGAFAWSFDACGAAQRGRAVKNNKTDAQSCLLDLMAMQAEANGTLDDVFPYSAPPLWDPLAVGGATACGAGEVLSPRAGGECVSCQWGAAGTEAAALHSAPGGNGGEGNATTQAVAACTCVASSYRIPVGTAACHEPLVIGFAPTTLDALPDRVCEYFVAVRIFRPQPGR